jgi:colanic acid/amylovoran biosynthesis glycosyltransferase
MRVAYVVDHYPAVSHTFILREVEALRRRGVEVDTISLQDSADHVLTPADREAHATTYAVRPAGPLRLAVAHLAVLAASPRRYARTLALAVRLGRLGLRGPLWGVLYFGQAVLVHLQCRRRRTRHLHAHFAGPSPDIALLAAALGGPDWTWSFTAHGSDIFQTSRALLAEKVRRADAVVAVSDFGRAQLLALVDEEHWPRVRVVHCGLPSGDFTPPPGARDSADGPLKVLSIGRLAPEKGQGVLLEAVGELTRRGVAVHCTFVGDGPRRAALEGRAGELALDGSVTFAGRVGQDVVRELYGAADVFCLPSFAEGVPVVLMESLAMGVPVVASGIMGIPELVGDGVDGLLVPPGRPDLLADALERLAADPALRRRLAEHGRRHVAEEFDVDVSAGRLVDVFAAAQRR